MPLRQRSDAPAQQGQALTINCQLVSLTHLEPFPINGCGGCNGQEAARLHLLENLVTNRILIECVARSIVAPPKREGDAIILPAAVDKGIFKGDLSRKAFKLPPVLRTKQERAISSFVQADAVK